jgi:hypothetical protein
MRYLGNSNHQVCIHLIKFCKFNNYLIKLKINKACQDIIKPIYNFTSLVIRIDRV